MEDNRNVNSGQEMNNHDGQYTSNEQPGVNGNYEQYGNNEQSGQYGNWDQPDIWQEDEIPESKQEKKVWPIVLIITGLALLLIIVLVVIVFVIMIISTKFTINSHKVETITEIVEVTQEESTPIPTVEAPSEKDGEEDSVPESGGQTTENNYSEAVKYNGTVYRRVYDLDDYSEEALWGDFEYVPGTRWMTSVAPDGTVTELFEDKGDGDFFLYLDTIYSDYTDENGKKILYKCALDGTDYSEIGEYSLTGGDEVNGKIYYRDNTDARNLYCYDCITGDAVVAESGVNEVFCVTDGSVYFTVTDWTLPDEVKVFRYDGKTGQKYCLADMKTEDIGYEEFEPEYMVVENLQIVGGKVYFYYGGYSGTAYCCDGGHIISVNPDGSDYHDWGTGLDVMAMADYYLIEGADGIEIHFQDYINVDNYKIMASGECLSDDTSYSLRGHVFWDTEGNVQSYLGTDGVLSLLLPSEVIDSVGMKEALEDADGEQFFGIKSVEIVDGWVYFTMFQGRHNAAADIGWRYSYQRTAVVSGRYEMSTGTLVLD